jgi:hypothetical protein
VLGRVQAGQRGSDVPVEVLKKGLTCASLGLLGATQRIGPTLGSVPGPPDERGGLEPVAGLAVGVVRDVRQYSHRLEDREDVGDQLLGGRGVDLPAVIGEVSERPFSVRRWDSPWGRSNWNAKIQLSPGDTSGSKETSMGLEEATMTARDVILLYGKSLVNRPGNCGGSSLQDSRGGSQ